jgi:hypothetical protein
MGDKKAINAKTYAHQGTALNDLRRGCGGALVKATLGSLIL